MGKSIYFFAILLVINYDALSQDTLLNNTVISLYKAGLGKTTIIAKINTSATRFDMSTEKLIELKKIGLPDDIIDAMINKDSKSSIATTIVEQGDKRIKLSSGIYYCQGNPCAYFELEPSVYSSSNTGSGLATALTYGLAKTKQKAMLSGKEANLQIKNSNPVFYFFFDKTEGGNLSNSTNIWFANATSPNEFILVKFKISSNKKNREVVTGSWNSYEGLTSGIEETQKIEFKYEKISQGAYKVYFVNAIPDGEYCFMYAGGVSYGNFSPVRKVFDFGIINKN